VPGRPRIEDDDGQRTEPCCRRSGRRPDTRAGGSRRPKTAEPLSPMRRGAGVSTVMSLDCRPCRGRCREGGCAATEEATIQRSSVRRSSDAAPAVPQLAIRCRRSAGRSNRCATAWMGAAEANDVARAGRARADLASAGQRIKGVSMRGCPFRCRQFEPVDRGDQSRRCSAAWL
jgi:hypothetical protein